MPYHAKPKGTARKHIVSFRLADAPRDQIEKQCKERGISRSELLSNVVLEYLARVPAKSKGIAN